MRHPIAVGGVGGSGTRVLRAILADSGVMMGQLVSASGDSIEMYHFHQVYLNSLLDHVRSVDYALDDVPPFIRRSTIQGLSLALRIVATQPDPPPRPWGFKCPPSIYVLPFLQNAVPDFVFLHAVRDGRDMVLSGNRAQLDRHYAALFGEPIGADPDMAQARLWNAVNLGAARWASTHMADRYHVVRYEDLCRQPAETIASMMNFLQASPDEAKLSELAARVAQPANLGHWRSLEAARIAQLSASMQEGLSRFGYVQEPV